MKLLAAIDSFKGSATSKELNEALLDAVHDSRVTKKISVPIADGGEGTLEALYEGLGGKYVVVTVPDLMGDLIEVQYLLTNVVGKRTAIIESAAVVGIDRITPSEETVRKASSFGLGKLLREVITHDVETIYLTLGGSGTSDGGLGLLAGLGGAGIGDGQENPLYTFTDIQLDEVTQLFQHIQLAALADVTNPYVGEHGFSAIFGPQKGASPAQIREMERLAIQAAQQLRKASGQDIAEVTGAGAAGGLGGAILALGGEIIPGFQTISELIDLESKISQADLIITGEGRLDAQTQHGKVPFGVASLARRHHKPVIAIAGTREADIGIMSELLLGAFAIHLGPITLTEALDKETTLKHLRITGNELVKVFLRGSETND